MLAGTDEYGTEITRSAPKLGPWVGVLWAWLGGEGDLGTWRWEDHLIYHLISGIVGSVLASSWAHILQEGARGYLVFAR